ncbi:MAG TPA: riboflavin synthase, partial [Syntrophales bacterium]|nr:riboflavin synthase [Syntrophales bacterium]
MFTGIIEGVGIVKRTARRGEDILLSIATSMSLDDVSIGDSVAVSGVCLTVVEVMEGTFSADVSAETLAKTTLRELRIGGRVNLEKALTLQS